MSAPSSIPRRPRAAGAALVALVGLLAPHGARAQEVSSVSAPEPTRSVAPPAAPAVPRRPAYRALRFDERWPAAVAADPHDPFDPLKHVALGRGVHLTVGGQLRVRTEGVQHFQLGDGADRDDVFELLRATLGVDVRAGRWGRVFVEGRHAMAFGRGLPGGTRPQDEDRADLQNAFAELSCCGGERAWLRVGRQEIVLGSERLIGLSDWANARRGWEGARASVRVGPGSVEAFGARPVLGARFAPNRGDDNTTLAGVVGTSEVAGRELQLYALGLRQREATFAGVSGAQRRATFGARAEGRALTEWSSFEVEGAVQRGTLGAQAVRAWFVASELAASWPRRPLAPTVALGADWASGDRDSTDLRAGTFHQLFPSAHGFLGQADLLGRQNVREVRVTGGVTLPGRVQLRMTAHDFARVSRADGSYLTNGSELHAADGVRDLAVGREVDANVSWAVGAHVRVQAAYGHFVPGRFLRGAGGGTPSVDWSFAGTTFTF